MTDQNVGTEEIRYSPYEIAEALGDFPPTEQQAVVISSPLTPRLVVAGAGSGKTTTMSDRVAWLVANGLARPEEILGVTFTRKAAGELSHRIAEKLRLLRRAGLIEDPAEEDDAPEAAQEPTVSTYHSYANTLVRSYGLRLGIESDTVLLGQAQTWQLASDLVRGWDGPLPESVPAADTLVKGLITLSSEASEHLVDTATIRDFVERFRRGVQDAPPDGRKKTPGSKVKAALARMERTEVLAQLVDRFHAVKREESALDYGDLLSLAARIVQVDPHARAAERDRFKVVLLDEFQDTSHAQLALFSGLYGEGHCVMAVGDPQQSIYGFRGASAGQLFSFVENFPRRTPDGQRAVADTSFLTTAWRNSLSVLDVANAVAEPLRTAPSWNRSAASLRVPPLDPSPQAVRGRVRVSRHLTDTDEAQAVAQLISDERRAHEGQPLEEMPTMAVLCRRRAQFEPLRLELEALGIPYEVVGLGGLLHTPEVCDVVAMLHVLTDPGRSDALARLLAGARWRLGARDLAALGDWAAELERRHERASRGERAEGGTGASSDPASERGPQDDAAAGTDAASAAARHEGLETVVMADLVDRSSLIEAVETLPREGWVSSRGRSISAEGMRRLRALRADVRALRQVLGDELTTVIHEVETVLGLDIELAALPGEDPAHARRNLDAFADQAVQFTATTRTHDVAAFLAWLDAATREENGLDLPPAHTRRDAVQLLTVHASKGLEWDHVYVPGLNQDDFPTKNSSAWTGDAAKLPWPLRGDAAQLPQWHVRLDDVREVEDSFGEFTEDVAEHDLGEERRLAYVAFTRAKSLLELSGTVFRGTGKTGKAVSPFLQEARDMAERSTAGFEAGPWAEPEEGASNPQLDTLVSAVWPYDPLEGPRITRTSRDAEGRVRRTVFPPTHEGRRGRMEATALAVRQGGFPGTRELPDEDLATGASGARIARWRREAELLLAQREASLERRAVHMPAHVSASALVAMDENPEEFISALRRPMPRRPGSAARAGTAFHAWVEDYFGDSAIFDLDELPGADDHVDEELDLPRLAETFRRSPWASREPYAVELPVETPVGSLTVRGRIDAVFRTADGWELVDWKTGRVPRGGDLRRKAGQLALYRLAFARLHEVPVERVSAAFYYVAADEVVRPHDLADEAQLERIVSRLYERGTDPVDPADSAGPPPEA
ncbi:DNA helicase UvrD [Kocuria tytonicola]|uniref:ATP-dependent helicase n=1 Tax=Kocuria tytonicola TaxID=2055946 RepID=UPI000EF8F563|nr:ATP-dependent DNA helicase [Kocuria tytonicola]RLZ02637.1 DNA helicase UvrD [Kocuria tytonicola]